MADIRDMEVAYMVVHQEVAQNPHKTGCIFNHIPNKVSVCCFADDLRSGLECLDKYATAKYSMLEPNFPKHMVPLDEEEFFRDVAATGGLFSQEVEDEDEDQSAGSPSDNNNNSSTKQPRLVETQLKFMMMFNTDSVNVSFSNDPQRIDIFRIDGKLRLKLISVFELFRTQRYVIDSLKRGTKGDRIIDDTADHKYDEPKSDDETESETDSEEEGTEMQVIDPSHVAPPSDEDENDYDSDSPDDGGELPSLRPPNPLAVAFNTAVEAVIDAAYEAPAKISHSLSLPPLIEPPPQPPRWSSRPPPQATPIQATRYNTAFAGPNTTKPPI